MRKVRIGIIGCGGIANGKHMPSLHKLENVEMVAFCDKDKAKAEKAAAEFGIPEAKVYTDYKELLKDESIEVVHVCTPNRSHSTIAVAALDAGKHVMCEKPMAKTYKEAQKMLEARDRSGKKLAIGYQNRQCAENQYLKQMCDAGDLGEIYFAKAHAVRRRAVPTWGVFLNEYEQGGGPLIDIGTHALDLTLWMMNNYEPEMVVGTKYRKLADTENAANAWGSWDPEKFTVEDSAFGFIRMKNGATIILESSWALNTLELGEAQVTLCGTKAGADTTKGLRINGERFSKLYTIEPQLGAGGAAFYDGIEESPADADMRKWITAIVEDKDPVCMPEQAIVVSRILEAIYKSAATGKPVYFKD